jgi:hypothetical protein
VSGQAGGAHVAEHDPISSWQGNMGFSLRAGPLFFESGSSSGPERFYTTSTLYTT